MSDIFSAAGQVASAAITAGAIKDATQKQIAALERQRDFVYSELSPDKLQGAATSADIEHATNKLALQGQTDPQLLAARYAAQNKILQGVNELGTGPGSEVEAQATKEALAGTPGMTEAKQKLVDAALHELALGASLPPDVQNELVQAGLEKTGMVSGAATPKGLGGNILRHVLGTAGIQLQADRQQRAAGLLQSAQSLESNRQQVLQTLFPNLAKTQLDRQAAAQSALTLSNNLMPNVGLSGGDIANIWLSRVGSTNQLAQSAADAAARGGMGVAQAWQGGIGGATAAGANALPSTASVWNSMFKSNSGPSQAELNSALAYV